MKAFLGALRQRQPKDTSHRGWLFLPYDQLSDQLGPLAREAPEALGIVLVENRWHLARRPYHRQKLAYVISNLRHFALEQAARGVAVRYLVAQRPYRQELPSLVEQLGPLRVMMPAERELRVDIQPLVETRQIEVMPHEGWLTTHEHFRAARKRGPPWRMDVFYRYVRRQTGVLMEQGKPVGGKFSFDPENREPWRGAPAPPELPVFAVDPVKREVGELIESEFSRHPGNLDLTCVPASAEEADELWRWAKRKCLPHFGPYEDAMSSHASGLFHTRASALINLHRLLPARVVAEVERMQIPLPSKEGFIRQLLGWREFIHHVHVASDGFRHLPGGDPEVAPAAGAGGYARWAGRPWPKAKTQRFMDGGSMPCALGCGTPLPPAYWGERSGLACLDHVVSAVWREGWSHHITRLVVLSSIATMLDVSPRELTDWFWMAYVDSQDWVVEPNVLGMGMFAVGDYMSTKPYVTGAGYINRMSDFCGRCSFNPRRTCPLTRLYWAFLARHERALRDNPRMKMVMASMRKRAPGQRRQDQSVFRKVRDLLSEGRAVALDDIPAQKL